MGFFVSPFIVVSTGFIQDSFSTDQRGAAFGYQQLPVVLMPIIGPIIGGNLTHFFGWRSTSFALFVITVIIMLITLPFLPETLEM